MTFESEGLYIVAFLHMVAAGELCCLSDNSGSILADVFNIGRLLSILA